MKTIKISVVLILSVLTFSCGSSKEAATSAEIEESISESVDDAISELEEMDEQTIITENVSASEFKKLYESGKGLLLDVRTPNEVAQGKIDGATNLDFYSPTFKADLDKLDKSKPVYVYCRSGSRSGKTMKHMKDSGFKIVYNLIGGYSSWPYK